MFFLKLVHIQVVNASVTELVAVDKSTGKTETLATSMFGEQLVAFWKETANAGWQMFDINSAQLKDSKSGFVELAGIAGSNIDLQELEEKEAEKKLKEKQHANQHSNNV